MILRSAHESSQLHCGHFNENSALARTAPQSKNFANCAAEMALPRLLE